jgi:predicted metalloendopeptidase
MVNEVKYAFKKNLPNLSWMDDETRQAAKEKVDSAYICPTQWIEKSTNFKLKTFKCHKFYMII